MAPKESSVMMQRRLEAAHLQEIEGNPLDASQIAMFEMFEREQWPSERRLNYIAERVSRLASANAAE